jgi:hypothetical protein
MQAGGLVVVPGIKRFLPEGFTLFLTRHVLLNGFTHQPVHWAPALIGQCANPYFQRFRQANRNRG